MTPTISMIDQPGPDIRQAIVAPLIRFNGERSGQTDVARPLVLTLSLPGSNEIIGGLWGATGRDYLHVDLLFVPEKARGSGVGRTLMQQAEEEALRRGCHGAWLDTYSFQARGFYEKLGYTVFGRLDDYSPGHSRFFLTKRLGPDETAGATDSASVHSG